MDGMDEWSMDGKVEMDEWTWMEKWKGMDGTGWVDMDGWKWMGGNAWVEMHGWKCKQSLTIFFGFPRLVPRRLDLPHRSITGEGGLVFTLIGHGLDRLLAGNGTLHKFVPSQTTFTWTSFIAIRSVPKHYLLKRLSSRFPSPHPPRLQLPFQRRLSWVRLLNASKIRDNLLRMRKFLAFRSISAIASLTSHSRYSCLGIDIGSCGTRVCIWKMSTGTGIVVEDPRHHSLTRPYTPCDFPSSLYVFDDISQDVYPRGEEDPSRRCVSAKHVLRFLANASDAVLEQDPSVQHLMERKDEPNFGRQLHRGMIALLSALRDAAGAVCREHGLRIVKIGLITPVGEAFRFESVYRALVIEVFEMVDASQIYFFAGVESLLRYLYKYHARKLDPNGQYDTILFFDFGGYNMVSRTAVLFCSSRGNINIDVKQNGCLFKVARDQGGPDGSSIFGLDKPFCESLYFLSLSLGPITFKTHSD